MNLYVYIFINRNIFLGIFIYCLPTYVIYSEVIEKFFLLDERMEMLTEPSATNIIFYK